MELEGWESWVGTFQLESQWFFLEGAQVLSHTSTAEGCRIGSPRFRGNGGVPIGRKVLH